MLYQLKPMTNLWTTLSRILMINHNCQLSSFLNQNWLRIRLLKCRHLLHR
jgi:hypothetical protein